MFWIGCRKVLTPDELEIETSILYLNNEIVELEQQIHDLEALNQVMKEQAWQKQGKIELAEEVKEQKCQVKIWKFWASKCYKLLKKVTKQLKKGQGKKMKVVKAGTSIQVQDWKMAPYVEDFWSR